MKDYTPKIPKQELIHGAYYFGRCRNASVARWNGEEQIFYHWRSKFGETFLECIHCPEDDSVYDVFIAERKLEPDEIDKEIRFNTL